MGEDSYFGLCQWGISRGSTTLGAREDDVGFGWPEGVRASGRLSDSDGAAAGQPCHTERSEASRSPARQTLCAAKGDTVRHLRLMLIGRNDGVSQNSRDNGKSSEGR
jgi:hypothetical protein